MRISDWSSDVCSSDLATGIIAPKIETEAEARLLAAACRFPPVGQRSMIARIPQTGFVRSPVNEFVKAENQKVVVQVLIESSLGVENIDSIAAVEGVDIIAVGRSEEHTSELQSLMRISYAVFCLKKKKHNKKH